MNAHQKGNAESGQLKSVSQTIPEDMLKDNMTNIYYNIYEKPDSSCMGSQNAAKVYKVLHNNTYIRGLNNRCNNIRHTFKLKLHTLESLDDIQVMVVILP